MKVLERNLKSGLLAIALAGTCAPPGARADDAEIAALKMPANVVEVGVAGTSRSSARFGEYNGLNKSGETFVGGLSLRGGDAYGDTGGTMRWSIIGTDLGLTTRTLGGTISDQGRWSLGIKYDELRHNLSDTYQTPYRGSMGGNVWTLAPGFGTTTNTTTMTAAQRAALQPLEINSTRKNTSISAGLNLNAQWDIKFDFNHLDQSGAKLMGFGSALSAPGTNEYISILPAPTNYKTDTVNLALNWVGDKGNASASYFGSYFRNGVDRISFQTFGAANFMQTMSVPPGNDLHQFNLAGGYRLLPKTKLAGNFSYARNTQNDPFVVDPFMYAATGPAPGNALTSANALVVNTHADIKLTDQTIKDLALTAGLKFDERDNRTASNIYNFHAISGSAGNIALYPNTPLSTRKTQLELAGDYRLKKDQHVRLGFTHDDTSRRCNQYGVNANYPAGTNCVVATGAKEDKIDATYRIKAYDSLNIRAGYAYGKRTTDFDRNARAAFIGTNGTGVAVGGIPGQNAGDFPGFHPFLDANRRQHMLKANANWDANDRLTLGLGGRFTGDTYDTTYGIQNGKSWSLNLDAAFRYSENGTLTSYVTQQHMERTMTDLQSAFPTLAQQTGSATALPIPPGASWTDKLKNDDVTFGLGVRHTGLMSGKLELAGDYSFSMARTDYTNQLNYQTFIPVGVNAGASCAANIILSCGATSPVKITTVQFKFSGIYEINKKSKLALRYLYQRLDGADYYYNGYQLGFTPTKLMPTNQQLGNYSVNVISASYIHTF